MNHEKESDVTHERNNNMAECYLSNVWNKAY